MFIIWGFGRQTKKSFGFVDYHVCGRCHNTTQFELVKITTWFTLFFIPVIPYHVKHFRACPICGAAQEMTKEEWERIIGGELVQENAPYHAGSPAQEIPDSVKYAGKTSTQIAYLKQMEEYHREQENSES